MITTISNLYPRPDQPTRGMYNYYLFREMGELLSVNGYSLSRNSTSNRQPITDNNFLNICLVPEWRVWRWPGIRRWKAPSAHREEISCSVAELLRDSPKVSLFSTTQQPNNSATAPLGTIYLPVFYLPVIGRSINWWFAARALRAQLLSCSVAKLPPAAHREEISCQVAKLLRDGPKVSLSSTTQQLSNSTTDRASGTTQQPTTNNPINGATGTFYVPWLYPDGVAVASAIKGTGARLWLMALGSDTFHLSSGLRRRMILEACTQAEGIICVAKVLADRLAEAGVPREKLHVVPNGVDTSLFRVRNKEELSDNGYSLLGDTTNNRQPITDNRCPVGATLLYVGNLVPVKGVDVLLEAVALLREKRTSNIQHSTSNIEQAGSKAPDVSPLDAGSSMLNVRCSPSLLLIGDGPMRAMLVRLAENLGIADQVRFLGRLPPEEVSKWMNRADCLCLPSRSEGMPNVVLEARACGCPVVATPAGACPELSLSKDHFLVTEDYTASALAKGLREMLGRDLSHRQPDPAIPTWHQQAKKILELMGLQLICTYLR